jgi:hypothetical protein
VASSVAKAASISLQQQTQPSQVVTPSIQGTSQTATFTGSQATWTGNSTLTYTQSMQPPPQSELRSPLPGYCKHKCCNCNRSWFFAFAGSPDSSSPAATVTALASSTLRMLSSQPPPEYWCSIAYFELDTQVSDAHTPNCTSLFFLINLKFQFPKMHCLDINMTVETTCVKGVIKIIYAVRDFSFKR